jgi:hypothetical protein
VTALFATAGATNAGLYPAVGIGDHLVSTGQFPPAMARRLGGRASVSLLIVGIAVTLIVLVSDLSSIASIGSAVALAVFAIISIGHVRIRTVTGANLWILLLAIGTAAITLITFIFTTLINEPASIAALIGIVAISTILDVAWARLRPPRNAPAAGPTGTQLSSPPT